MSSEENQIPQRQNSEQSATLQTIMELQRGIGQLTESVNSLRTSIERQEMRFDRFESKVDDKLNQLSDIKTSLFFAGIVLLIVLIVGGFLVNKSWDLMVKTVTVSASKESGFGSILQK